ncbi:MAG: hypothetical protein WC872_03020 [Candidatus Absconditabacterales bacterium]
MLVFNGKETAKRIFKETGYLNYEYQNTSIDLLVNGLKLSLLNGLNQKPENAELGLLMFGNDPRSFISFKEKIKISLHSNIKLGFYHLSETDEDINIGLKIIDKVINSGGRIIIQSPINNKKIINKIKKLTIFQDIDNLKGDPFRFGFTQSAIIGLSNYIINKYLCENIAIIGSEGFIGKGIMNGLKNNYSNLNINGIDKKNNLDINKDEIINNSDLIISTASEKVNFPDTIKKGLSIIDCGLIRGNLGIRGSIPMKEKLFKNYNIITPTPGGIGPLEMLYLVLKVKNFNNDEIDFMLSKNVIFNNFNLS